MTQHAHGLHIEILAVRLAWTLLQAYRREVDQLLATSYTIKPLEAEAYFSLAENSYEWVTRALAQLQGLINANGICEATARASMAHLATTWQEATRQLEEMLGCTAAAYAPRRKQLWAQVTKLAMQAVPAERPRKGLPKKPPVKRKVAR